VIDQGLEEFGRQGGEAGEEVVLVEITPHLHTILKYDDYMVFYISLVINMSIRVINMKAHFYFKCWIYTYMIRIHIHSTY
jgi:hypothetical protein